MMNMPPDPETSKTTLLKAPQNGQGPFIGQKLKFLKVPHVGTLNLCLKIPEKMQKTRNDSDHPGLRNRPKTIKH